MPNSLGRHRVLRLVGVLLALVLQGVLVVQLAGHVHQLLGVEVVDYLVGDVLAVRCPGLHYGKQQLGGVVLELPDEVHPGAAEGEDVVEDEGGDDGQAVALVGGDAGLVVGNNCIM